MKKFNTAGPSVLQRHFMIDPLQRIDVQGIEDLIEDHRYFVLHAPRQTGKTTCLLALMKHLNQQGQHRALYANIEAAQAARGHVEEGIAAICSVMVRATELYLKDADLTAWHLHTGQHLSANDRLTALLTRWSQHDPQQPSAWWFQARR